MLAHPSGVDGCGAPTHRESTHYMPSLVRVLPDGNSAGSDFLDCGACRLTAASILPPVDAALPPSASTAGAAPPLTWTVTLPLMDRLDTSLTMMPRMPLVRRVTPLPKVCTPPSPLVKVETPGKEAKARRVIEMRRP